MAEKTEPPTRRRLRRALAEGDSPISAALVAAAGFAAVAVSLPWAVDSLARASRGWIESALSLKSVPPSPLALLRTATQWLVIVVATAAVPALLAGLAQTGGVVTAPRHERPKRPELLHRLFDGLRIGALVATLIAVAALILFVHRVDIVRVAGRFDAALGLARVAGMRTVYLAAAIVVGAALIDRVATGAFWLRRHRMSRHERKREARESEGDPELRRRRRLAHERLAREAPIAAVSTATVVIVEGAATAVALVYDDAHDSAPRLLAAGRGEEARRIVARAGAHRVPIVEHPALARSLAAEASGEVIAPAHYDAVASVLVGLKRPPA